MQENNQTIPPQSEPNLDLSTYIPTNREEAEKVMNFYREEDSKNAQKAWSFEDEAEEAPAEQNESGGEPAVDREQAKNDEFSFEIDGRSYKFNSQDLQKYVAEGLKATQKYEEIYSLQNKIAQEKAELERKVGESKHLLELDNWARENPELYHRMQLEYENQRNGGQFGEVPPYLAKFVADLNEVRAKLNEVDQIKQEHIRKQSDEALQKEIDTYKGKYSDFDWNSPDQSGLTLEQRIINHALQNGIQTFRAAANDYLIDEVAKRKEFKAKEEVAKTIQKNNKLGLLEQKSEKYTPKPINPRKLKSYDAVNEFILKNGV